MAIELRPLGAVISPGGEYQSQTESLGPVTVHACAHCEDFTVEEPAPQMVSDWTTDGRLTMRVTRFGWELPMVQHLYESHTDLYALMFRDRTIADAMLQVAAEAKRSLQQMLDRQMRSLGGSR